MFKTTRHDFGSVARGAKAEFAFEIENPYRETVRIASVRSSCGCTTPTIDKTELLPKEKAQVLATYNTRSFLGQKGATITVTFDEPRYAEVQLTVEGYIRSDVVFDPGEINFGEVDQFAGAEQKVTIRYAGRDNWKIVDVRSPNESYLVSLREPQRENGRITYEIVVKLKPDAPAGYFQDHLTIVTDDQRLQKIRLYSQGRVVSPLTVSPASLFLGVVDPGESVTKQLVVRGKQPFKITSVKCPDGCFTFPTPSDEKKTLHFIPVTFTAAAAQSQVAEEIAIETDLGAVVTCKATATVRQPTSGGESVRSASR